MIFFIYQILLSIILCFSPIIVIIRIIKNKEDKFRFKEKFCLFSKKRGSGKLIWFHGSSVGEILSVVPVIKKYENDKSISKILITSSTLSSSKVLEKIKFKKTIHQFYPIDHVFFSKKFLSHSKVLIIAIFKNQLFNSLFLISIKRLICRIWSSSKVTSIPFLD